MVEYLEKVVHIIVEKATGQLISAVEGKIDRHLKSATAFFSSLEMRKDMNKSPNSRTIAIAIHSKKMGCFLGSRTLCSERAGVTLRSLR